MFTHFPWEKSGKRLNTRGRGRRGDYCFETVGVIFPFDSMAVPILFDDRFLQEMANDIPMMSLCRTIEIDLREMLREKDLPPPIEAKNGVLM